MATQATTVAVPTGSKEVSLTDLGLRLGRRTDGREAVVRNEDPNSSVAGSATFDLIVSLPTGEPVKLGYFRVSMLRSPRDGSISVGSVGGYRRTDTDKYQVTADFNSAIKPLLLAAWQEATAGIQIQAGATIESSAKTAAKSTAKTNQKGKAKAKASTEDVIEEANITA